MRQSGNRRLASVCLLFKMESEMSLDIKMNVSKELKVHIGQKIKFFRKKMSLSQEQLAEMVNMETKSLSRIESGHNYPMYENLILISSALGVEPWQLYYMENKKDINLMKQEIISLLEEDKSRVLPVYQYLLMLK